MDRAIRSLAAAVLLLTASAARPHGMGVVYNLPIPFWMYAFAASAALVLSFLIVGYFVTAQGAARNYRTIEVGFRYVRADGTTLRTLRGLSVFVLLLTILAGILG